MALTRKQQARIDSRAIALMREIGTLLLTFAPLDYSLQERVNLKLLAAFIVVAVLLIGYSMIREARGVR